MKDVTDLRNKMLDVIERVDAGELEVKKAHVMASATDKAIQAAKAQLAYKAHTGHEKPIPFLDS